MSASERQVAESSPNTASPGSCVSARRPAVTSDRQIDAAGPGQGTSSVCEQRELTGTSAESADPSALLSLRQCAFPTRGRGCAARHGRHTQGPARCVIRGEGARCVSQGAADRKWSRRAAVGA